jgi:hypothetical protein
MKALEIILYLIFFISCTGNEKSETLLKCEQFVPGTSDYSSLNPLQVIKEFKFVDFQGDSISEGLRLIGTFANSDTIKVLTFVTTLNSKYVKIGLNDIIITKSSFRPDGKLVSFDQLKFNNRFSDSIAFNSPFILTLNSRVRIDSLPDVDSYEKGFYSFGTHGNLLIIEYKCGSNYKILYYPNLEDNADLLATELKSIGNLLDLVKEKFDLDLLHTPLPNFSNSADQSN